MEKERDNASGNYGLQRHYLLESDTGTLDRSYLPDCVFNTGHARKVDCDQGGIKTELSFDLKLSPVGEASSYPHFG